MSRLGQRRCLIIPSQFMSHHECYLLFSGHVQPSLLNILSTNDLLSKFGFLFLSGYSMMRVSCAGICSLIKRMMIRPCLHNLLWQAGKLEKFLHGNGDGSPDGFPKIHILQELSNKGSFRLIMFHRTLTPWYSIINLSTYVGLG